MPVLTDISQLCTPDPIADGAVVWQDDTLRWVGPESELPGEFADEPQLSAGGNAVIPGLVDCHTHLVFGGWRTAEFAMRIEGRAYLDIARAGGGIASTVAATRAATEAELVEKAIPVLDRMLGLGVTTVECKSGYGLTVADELKQLRAIRALNEAHPIELVPTLLGAHIMPPEFRDDREGWISQLTEILIPQVAAEGLARFCDVFVEDTAYTPAEARRIFAAGTAHGLRPRLHADQMSDTGGAALAAEVGAVSADHLEQASDAGLAAMAAAGVIGVTLPTATLYTFQPPLDCRRLVAAGVDVAVASDFNPGSGPSPSLPLAMMLACTLNRLTPARSLDGATRIAARSLGLERGVLAPGRRADLAVLDAPTVEHWLYAFHGGPALLTVCRGQIVAQDPR